jgi:hypothetical protein
MDRDEAKVEAQDARMFGPTVVEALTRGLAYQRGDDWEALPAWGRFFLELGAFIAARECADFRLVAGVATPTRAFAAALCATGVVAARAEESSDIDVVAHLAFLRGLPENTTVTYRRSPSVSTVGWLRGFSTVGDTEHIDIVTKATRLLLPTCYAYKVEVTPQQLSELPAHLRFKTIKAQAGLMGALLAGNALAQFISHSRMDCVVIGNEGTLRAEIIETPLAVLVDSQHVVPGALQHVMRARPWGSRMECYRSQVISAGRPATRQRTGSPPGVVVFDGSAAFLKWRGIWPRSGWRSAP